MAFGAGSDDVYADMLAALLSGEVDAVVDDDVVFVPLGATHPDYELALTVQTANGWGVAVSKAGRTCWPIRQCARSPHRVGVCARCGTWLPALEYPFPQ